MATVTIAGASGYSGQEALDRVLAHPHLELHALGSDSLAGQPAHALDPRLGRNGWRKTPHFITNEAALACGADVTLLCLPHERAAGLEPPPRGVVVDLSHMSHKSYAQALEIVTRPPMVSHTGISKVHEHWRNIDDAQIRAVADRGGCIGIIFARNYLGGKSIDCVVDHILHVIDIAGEDVPALGSDFDGFVVPPEGLEDIAAMPNLTVALSRRGVPPRVLEKILSHNALRVLDAVPAFGTLAA